MTLQQMGFRARVLAACACMSVTGMCAFAQSQAQSAEQHITELKQAREARAYAPEVKETFFLSHATTMNDLNDIQTALRNNFSWAKMYGVATQNAITVSATAEEMQGIKKMIAELDRPKKTYRVTYSVSDVESGKKTGTQQYSLVVAEGAKGMLKEGKRVPLVTGSFGETATPSQVNSQVQYMDVGVNIEASIHGEGLQTKVEMTRVADEKSGVGAQDPVIEQTMLESSATVGGGKPMSLGSIAVPGTTHHEEIEVTTELLGQ